MIANPRFWQFETAGAVFRLRGMKNGRKPTVHYELDQSSGMQHEGKTIGEPC